MTNTTTSTAPQLTVRAIVLSIILAMILAAANTYLGLFAGLTISSSIPAAVVSMAVLKVLGGGHILENNIVQTGASAAASIAAGVIFTIPALVILGYWSDFRYSWVLAIAGLGGILGVLFSVPLRRALIIEQKLTFPEGKCAAEVLKAGDDPARGVKLLAGSAAVGGVVKLLAGSGARLIPDTAAAAGYVGKGIAYVATNVSPALLGVGYIVGFNVGVVIVAGGVISWNIAIPVYSTFFLDGNPELAARISTAGADAAAGAIWGAEIRYLGVGAMLIGGLWTLVSLRKSILSGIRSGLAATRAGAGRVVAHTEQDLPMKPVLIAIVVFALPLLALYQTIVGDFTVSVPMTIIMIVAGFLFCSVSAYMAGLIGSSNNPVSGITIATILFASLVLILLMGRGAALGPVAAIMIGAVVCCAAAVAGDNLQDLKAGQIVGATPWRQQVMLAIGAVSCALVMAPVLNLLESTYGIGVPTAAHPKALLAPQATLMASVSKGMFGGVLPWGMVWTGGAIGAAIIALDEMLKARGARFRTPVLAAAVGIYLPLEFTVPIFLGGLVAHLVERGAGVGHDADALERLHRRGVLFSAGLITGEALMGILIAIPIAIFKNADVLALPERLQPGAWGEWLGLALFAAIAWFLFRVAASKRLDEERG
ncbi:MAG TPA: oligopeptide transporter, OPT family [Gammaproteobacteria bacterium]|nr:oligopeptide transporter, OPT family [Gammaproteobacteria bacterium]